MNDKYLQYDLEDFLNDDSFIAFVRKGDRFAVQQWEKILSNHPQLIPVAEEAELIVKSLRYKKNYPQKQQIEIIWKNIQKGIKQENKKSKYFLKHFYKIAIAAAIIIAFVSINYLFFSDNTIKTDKAEMTTITLPDQSTVDLNVDSKLIYKKTGWNKNRHIKLEGEAFFRVAKGNKFVVETPVSNIEVLGTSFNVYDRNKRLEVMCFTGKVRVINKITKDSILLLPGNTAVIDIDKEIEVYKFDANKKYIWKDRVISFDTKSLRFVFDELERIFDLSIVADNSILNRKFTGQLIINSKEKTLEKICWPMHLTYKIEDKTVYISE